MTKVSINRRGLLRAAASAAVAFPMINMGEYKLFAASETTYSARALNVVAQTQVVDMLSLVAPFGPMMNAAYSANPKPKDTFAVSESHIKKLLSSGVDVFHPAVGLGAEESGLFIGRMNALLGDHPDVLRRVDSIADFDDLKKGERVGFIIGLQNSDHFRELDDVNLYYNMGQRVSQLTYNSRNLIGTGSTDRADGGLSDFGVSIVERMNEVGMAVDVSHCGDKTTLDAFGVSKKPVLITHSNVRALVKGHVRCKPDNIIRAMAKAGSVMGITGVRNFLSVTDPTTIENVLDHIDYVVKLTGIEHVGVGSDMDMDGYDDIPEPAYSALKSRYKSSYAFRDKLDTDGFDSPKRIFDLTEGLIRRGYSDEHISMVLGRNFKRVLGDIWKA